MLLIKIIFKMILGVVMNSFTKDDLLKAFESGEALAEHEIHLNEYCCGSKCGCHDYPKITYTNFDEWFEQNMEKKNINEKRNMLIDFLAKINGYLIAHPHLQMNTGIIDEYLEKKK